MRRILVLLAIVALTACSRSAKAPNPQDLRAGDFLDTRLDSLRAHAQQAYEAKDYPAAAAEYLTLLRSNVEDNSSIYNLACCYGLMGKADFATLYLRRAVRAGFDDIGHILKDRDFDTVRADSSFTALLDSLVLVQTTREATLGEQYWTTAPISLPCRVHLPATYGTLSTYDLVIGLHGWGDTPESFMALGDCVNDVIFAAPQAPYAFDAGNNTGYSWMVDDESVPDLGSRTTAQSVAYIADTTLQLCAAYRVNRVYLMGFSQGCAMAYMAGISHPDLYNGLLCFGGWLNTNYLDKNTLRNGRTLSVFIAHGSQDGRVEPQKAREAKTMLEEYGYTVYLHSFEGGHKVDRDALYAGLEWLRKQLESGVER